MNPHIFLKGIEILDEKEKKRVEDILEEYYVRIKRQLKNVVDLEFNIKEYEKPGKLNKKHKFSVHVKVRIGKLFFEADAFDWELFKAVHKVLNKVMNEIEGKFHSSDQHNKIKRVQQSRKRE